MRLLKNSLIYFVGNFSTKLLSFFMLPLYTQYLAPEDYGSFDTIQSLTQLFVPIVFLKISDAVIRFLLDAGEKEWEKEKYVTNTLLLLVLCSVASLLVVPVLNYSYGHVNGFMFYMFFVSSAWHTVLQQIVRSIGKRKLYALCGSISTVVVVAFNLILILMFQLKAEALIISAIVSGLTVVVILFFAGKLFRYINFKTINFDVIKEMLRYCIPLIPNTLCWQLTTTFSKLYLGQTCGTDVQGLYAVANRMPSLITMLTGIFYLAWQEEGILVFNTDKRNQTYNRVFSAYLTLLIAGLLVLIPLSKFYISRFLAAEYGSVWIYLPAMLVTAVLSSLNSFLGTAYLGDKNTKAVLKTSLIAAGINVAIVLLFTKQMEIWSVVLGGVAAYAVLLWIRMLDIRKYVVIDISYKQLLCYILGIAATVVVYYYVKDPTITAIVFGIECVAGFFMLRPMLQAMVHNKLKKRKPITQSKLRKP